MMRVTIKACIEEVFMAKDVSERKTKRYNNVSQHGGAGGVWFAGFIGTLTYFLHYHSGTFKLVFLAFFKAVFWMAYLVYYLFQHLKI
jgi:hypothetical protein